MPRPLIIAQPSAWDRRRVLRTGLYGLGAAVSAPLLAACGGSSAASPETDASSGGEGAESTAPRPVDIGMGWIKNVEYGGSWIALENGFYESNGIAANFLQGGPNAPASPVAVASGDANIGVAAGMLAFIDAVLEGNDFVCFGTQYQTAPGAVLSLAAKPVVTPEDLVGITFLGQEGVDVTIDAVLAIAGLEPDYEFVVAGFTPDPLIEGQGDAYSCFLVNQPITLEVQYGLVQGTDFIVTPWADLGLPQYSNLYFADRTWLAEHRSEVVDFMRATILGWEANEADPSVAAELAVNSYGVDLGLDLAQQTRQNELQIPLMQSELTASSGLFRIDPDAWAGPMYDGMKAAGRSDLPGIETILDLSILDDVFEGANRLSE